MSYTIRRELNPNHAATVFEYDSQSELVVPATMTFKVHGRQITQSVAIFTTAFRKL